MARQDCGTPPATRRRPMPTPATAPAATRETTAAAPDRCRHIPHAQTAADAFAPLPAAPSRLLFPGPSLQVVQSRPPAVAGFRGEFRFAAVTVRPLPVNRAKPVCR